MACPSRGEGFHADFADPPDLPEVAGVARQVTAIEQAGNNRTGPTQAGLSVPGKPATGKGRSPRHRRTGGIGDLEKGSVASPSTWACIVPAASRQPARPSVSSSERAVDPRESAKRPRPGRPRRWRGGRRSAGLSGGEAQPRSNVHTYSIRDALPAPLPHRIPPRRVRSPRRALATTRC